LIKLHSVFVIVLSIFYLSNPILFIEHVLFLDLSSSYWFIRFNPNDVIYLSIADDYIVFRIWISSQLNVKEVYVIVNETFISMKKQFSLIDWIVWYGVFTYTGKPLYYRFKIVLVNGTSMNIYRDGFNDFYFDGVDRFPQVKWVKNGVVYQIFPDRFYNGDTSNDQYALESDMWSIVEKYEGSAQYKPVLSEWSDPITNLHCCHQYYGGDLRGIIEKLDYLYDLGVRLIYLNPIFLSGSAHGYDPYDYYKVDPKFGTLEDLRELIDKAHEKGIKIIFDYVPDHVGIGFWAFLDVREKGRESDYWNWFTIYKWPFKLLENGAYDCWWGFPSLPRLRTDNPEVREYLYNVAMYWLEFGFDGFRVDTPLDVRDSVNFFKELRLRVKSKYPDAYIVGEIWDYNPFWVNGSAFDSLMNYALGIGIVLDYAQGKLVGSGRDHVSYRLAYYYANYGVNVAGMGFNIISSHDTDRLLTMVGGGGLRDTPSREAIDRLKLASTIQFTLPGAPVIFQGDERGIGGRKNYYDEQRYPIQWDRLNNEIYEHYRKLGLLKTTLKPLQTSIIRVFETTGSLLVFTRGYDDEIIVVASNDRVSRTYQLPEGNWIILYTTRENTVLNNNVLTIPPLTAVILLKERPVEETVSETTIESTIETSISTPTEGLSNTTIETLTNSREISELQGDDLSKLIVLTILLIIFVIIFIITRRVFYRKPG